MANTKEFFLSVVQRIFSNWTALRLAVEHGMGPVSNAVDLCSYMTEVFYMNEGLSGDDIAAELEEYMAVNFGTELHDDSDLEIAEDLLRFHRYCTEGNEPVAIAEFEKLPPLQPWLVSTSVQRKCNSAPTNRDSSSDEDMDTDDLNNSSDSKNLDEGWTKVTNRRKR